MPQLSLTRQIDLLFYQSNEKPYKGSPKKRPSLMNRIVDMLHRKPSLPVQSRRKSRKITDSSSCSSCSCSDENECLLDEEDRNVDITYFDRNKIRKRSTGSNYDDDLSAEVLRERKFTTKQLPRYLRVKKDKLLLFLINLP